MTSSGMDRLAVVRDLLELSRPLEKIMAQLAVFDWDYEGAGVKLTKKHLSMALQRYLRGEFSGFEIESWANQIEGREDIQFEADSVREIGDVLYELANPTLTQPLDYARAKTLLDELLVP
ncbi:hypothetical protein [Paraburkholderia sp. D1E]|uniref:hypothetical protein n=1 Tax=Paraburkholderia sp. D1E TaxID=3461398 RepID=UPI004045BED8